MTHTYQSEMPRPKKTKYRNRRIKTTDGWFDSKGEMCRWLFLKDCQKRGLIYDLQRQVHYDLSIDGWHICDYVADFVYKISPPPGERMLSGIAPVVEDFKGVLTDVFKLKAKMFRAVYGYHIKITTKPTEAP